MAKSRATWLPIKPAPPVINMLRLFIISFMTSPSASCHGRSVVPVSFTTLVLLSTE